LGNTKGLNKEDIEALPAVERAIRISEDYRIPGTTIKTTIVKTALNLYTLR